MIQTGNRAKTYPSGVAAVMESQRGTLMHTRRNTKERMRDFQAIPGSLDHPSLDLTEHHLTICVRFKSTHILLYQNNFNLETFIEEVL
jgi:hypothetical protein